MTAHDMPIFRRDTPNPPLVYCAGKISKNDWRHDLIDGLRGAACDDVEVFDIDNKIDCGSFTYIGPHFISCDHGCSHCANRDGIADSCNNADYMGPLALQHKKIFDINLRRLRMADLVFAFLETDAFGTLIELGAARGWGIPIALRLPPHSRADMWMVEKAATPVYHGTAAECWRAFCADFLTRLGNPHRIGAARPTKKRIG
jgi:hypothetical protein